MLRSAAQVFAAAPAHIATSAASPLATVTYKAFGPENGEYELEIEYSLDGGRTYSSTIPDNPLDAYCVATSPEGEEGLLEWDFLADLNGATPTEVLVRLRLVDGEAHQSAWTSTSFRPQLRKAGH